MGGTHGRGVNLKRRRSFTRIGYAYLLFFLACGYIFLKPAKSTITRRRRHRPTESSSVVCRADIIYSIIHSLNSLSLSLPFFLPSSRIHRQLFFFLFFICVCLNLACPVTTRETFHFYYPLLKQPIHDPPSIHISC